MIRTTALSRDEGTCSHSAAEKFVKQAAEQPAAAPGPPAAAITYPYYTVRGPRDFLAKNPPSIGP